MALVCSCVCTTFLLLPVLWGGYYWAPLCDLRFPCSASFSRPTRVASGSRDREGMAGQEACLILPDSLQPFWPRPVDGSRSESPRWPHRLPWDWGSLVLCIRFFAILVMRKETVGLRRGLESGSCIWERRFFCWPLILKLHPRPSPKVCSVAPGLMTV